MIEASQLNQRILAFAKKKRGKLSYQLIANHFDVSRNVVAGIVFRDRHPCGTRVSSPNGNNNKIGTGYHGHGAYPEMTAQNTR